MPGRETAWFFPTITGSPGDPPGVLQLDPAESRTVAAFSAEPSPYVIGSGEFYNATPDDWPQPGDGLIETATIDITSITEQARHNGMGNVRLALSRPDTLAPVSGPSGTWPAEGGTWSGANGSLEQYRSSSVDCYRLDPFGRVDIDHAHIHGANYQGAMFMSIADTPYNPPFSSTVVEEVDAIVEIRADDWDDCVADGQGIARIGDALGFYRTTTGVEARITAAPNGGVFAGYRVHECPWANLGFTDGEWEWLRVRVSVASGGIEWFTSSNGSSWTLAHFVAIDDGGDPPVDTFVGVMSFQGACFLGHGGGSRPDRWGEDFDGDIRSSRCTVDTPQGAGTLYNVNVPLISDYNTQTVDGPWGAPPITTQIYDFNDLAGRYWDSQDTFPHPLHPYWRGTQVSENVTVTCEFPEPIPPEDFMFIVEIGARATGNWEDGPDPAVLLNTGTGL